MWSNYWLDDHLAVVKGCWSAISQKFHTVILLWAGVGVVGYFVLW